MPRIHYKFGRSVNLTLVQQFVEILSTLVFLSPSSNTSPFFCLHLKLDKCNHFDKKFDLPTTNRETTKEHNFKPDNSFMSKDGENPFRKFQI